MNFKKALDRLGLVSLAVLLFAALLGAGNWLLYLGMPFVGVVIFECLIVFWGTTRFAKGLAAAKSVKVAK